ALPVGRSVVPIVSRRRERIDTGQRPNLSYFDCVARGSHIRRHQASIRSNVNDLFAIPPPARKGSSVGRDLPLAAGPGGRPGGRSHVDLELVRLVGNVCHPSSIRRESRPVFYEGRLQEKRRLRRGPSGRRYQWENPDIVRCLGANGGIQQKLPIRGPAPKRL